MFILLRLIRSVALLAICLLVLLNLKIWVLSWFMGGLGLAALLFHFRRYR